MVLQVMLKKAGFAATDEKFAIAFHTVLRCADFGIPPYMPLPCMAHPPSPNS